jgi:hypothetical protein
MIRALAMFRPACQHGKLRFGTVWRAIKRRVESIL